jgi:MoxR-like ATPase
MRRALTDGSTCDEDSEVVSAILEADRTRSAFYHLIYLREIGRTHSSSVQGGLLNLMTLDKISLPHGRKVQGKGIGWIADSNYQAASENVHTLVTFDDALKRRFTANITLNYLSAEDEELILDQIVHKTPGLKPDPELTAKIVALGNQIRSQRAEGNLQSLAPPSLYGYIVLFRKVQRLKHLDFKLHAMATLLGNASSTDLKLCNILVNQILGYKGMEDRESVLNDTLF